MPLSIGRSLALAPALLIAVAPAARSQDGRTRVAFSVSPSFITFAGFGGRLGAAVARLSVSRGITPNTGAELSLFALAPTGAVSAVPACVSGGTCQTRTTPSALTGVALSAYASLGESPVRVFAGAGAVRATGGEGFERRATSALVLGAEWVSRSTSWFAPSIGVRFAQLSTPLAGARLLFLPGVGLSF